MNKLTERLGILTILIGISEMSIASPYVVGWIEPIIVNGDFIMHAKIDSGADNSSINLVNPEYFDRKGQRWVRFSITNREGEMRVFEKPVVRTTSIKKKDGGRQERDVVELTMCLGTVQKTIQANLVDRSHFKYQLLVGRSYLDEDFLINPSQTYLTKPACSGTRTAQN